MVEQCSDVIISLTQLIPDFKTVLRFDDLSAKPGKLNLERYIRNKAPIMYLRRQLIKHPFTDAQIDKQIAKELERKVKSLGKLKFKRTET